jgi:hypothetical protein
LQTRSGERDRWACILADDFYPATNLKYQHLPPGVELIRMNVPKYLDQNAKWTRLYKDILAQQVH